MEIRGADYLISHEYQRGIGVTKREVIEGDNRGKIFVWWGGGYNLSI